MSAFAPDQVNPLSLPSLPLEWRKALPDCAGIYFAIDGNDVVQYIGRSNNIRLRWAVHHKRKELEKAGEIKLAWLEVSDCSLLPAIEEALINSFTPSLNEVPGFPVLRQPSCEPIGWRLRMVMAEKNIRNGELAELSGIHPTTISRLKSLDKIEIVKVRILAALCNGLTKAYRIKGDERIITPGDLFDYSFDGDGDPTNGDINSATTEKTSNGSSNSGKSAKTSAQVVWLMPSEESA
ncbi:helix-turn-helix domain-containing protein [Nostoc sp. TCL240-02]|uniref:helix-turn-helix domain-containing protein n=1 Tax=Nostoc sp. TCL240-02 TaxID=2572090 RepID=UPI00157F94D8|nr:helix-turn-helix domain-containing protein [Nostoc sp. TCL240-02]